MKIRNLLAVAAASASVASASAFEWIPVSLFPMSSSEVTSLDAVTTVRFQVYEVEGVAVTDIMPVWVSDDDNEVVAIYGSQDDFNPNQFVYEFNSSDFKSNGEYVLLFPEGMLVNAAKEKSDKIEIPYTFEISELAPPMFDDFKVLSVDPDLSSPQGIWDDQVITINTNHNEAIGRTTLTITDLTDSGLYATSVYSYNSDPARKLGDPSPITWVVAKSYKFYEEHEYKAELVFYNGEDQYDSDGNPTPVVARETYTFTGKVEGFKYSDIELVSIDPEPYSITISEPSQAVFTYTFSGPVDIIKATTPRGMNDIINYPESCLTANADKTVWTLDLSNNDYVKTVDAELEIYVYAKDLDGYQLQGNWGFESESCFTGSWLCDIGAKEIVVVTPEKGQTLDRLTEIVVKSVSGEEMSYNWGNIEIQNLLGEPIGSLIYVPVEGKEKSNEFHFTQWLEGADSWDATPLDIVKEGSYVIYFPVGTFVFGQEFESVNSRSLYSGFQITGALDDTPEDPGVDPAKQETLEYTAVDPENGSTVEKIDVIKISFAEDIMLNGCDVVVYSADQKVVGVGMGDVDWDNFAFDYVLVKLNEPITEPGRYMVSIPARSIATEGYEEGKTGTCIPEIHLFYTIESAEGPDNPGVDPAEQETFEYTKVDPENDSTVASLESIKLWFPEMVACDEFNIEVFDASNNSVVSGTGLYDWDDVNLIVVTLSKPVTEAGKYVVVIPARVIGTDEFMSSGGKSGICNPEIRLTYTVDPNANGVDSISDASLSNVYDMQGRIVLRDASSDALKSLEKGIYIVGGKKVVVK